MKLYRSINKELYSNTVCTKMAKFDPLWLVGLIGGWYASQYIYNHYIADTVQSLDAMLLTEPTIYTQPEYGFRGKY